jgi:hypothetical protein
LIWNTDFEAFLDKTKKRGAESAVSYTEANGGAEIKFDVLRELDDPSVDLSYRLSNNKASLDIINSNEASSSTTHDEEDASSIPRPKKMYDLAGWNYVPTRREKNRWVVEWNKNKKYSSDGSNNQPISVQDIRDIPASRPASADEAERRRVESEASFRLTEEGLFQTVHRSISMLTNIIPTTLLDCFSLRLRH